MRPVFSIIIPVYNVAPYLRECLDSVLAQNFPDWEAICVDDGSIDESGAILDEYAAKDKRFRVIHKENGGVSSARNVGLDTARGAWVWFVDGDDMIHPNAMEHIKCVLDANRDVEVYAFDGFIRDDNSLVEWPGLDFEYLEITSEHSERVERFFHYGACNVIFGREKFGSLRVPAFSIGEDVLFNNYIFWGSRCLAIEGGSLYFYRDRGNGASCGNVSLQAVRDNIEVEQIVLHNNIQASKNYPEFKMDEYLKRVAGYYLVMNMNKFLLISNADREKLLGDWMNLQTMVISYGGGMRYLKPVVAILKKWPNGWLAGKLVKFVFLARNRSLIALLLNEIRKRISFSKRGEI